MSTFIQVEKKENIAFIRLDRGKSNAIDLEMVKQLTSVIKQIENDASIRSAVLLGKEGFFSAGLDLISLYDYDEAKMESFWEAFIGCVQQLLSFPKPLIGAITGHSPAAGCLLALCCDYRIMAEGDYIIGLNEIPVGIVVPHAISKLYGFWIGNGLAARLLLEGSLLTPEQALSTQLVDQLVPLNRIHTAAERKAQQYMQFDPGSWQQSKINIRKELIKEMEQSRIEMMQQVLQQWWRKENRTRMRSIIESLVNKGK